MLHGPSTRAWLSPLTTRFGTHAWATDTLADVPSRGACLRQGDGCAIRDLMRCVALTPSTHLITAQKVNPPRCLERGPSSLPGVSNGPGREELACDVSSGEFLLWV